MAVTVAAFRKLALAQPEAAEVGHMGHPDFRVRNKIFATLGYPDAGHGMVKLNVEQREGLVDAEPRAFAPVPGGWGRTGATLVNLRAVSRRMLAAAMELAWENAAPRKLAAARRAKG
jgi:hypothetical protein